MGGTEKLICETWWYGKANLRNMKVKDSAKGAEYDSHGQARSASPMVKKSN